jgi:hypothetical protein
MINAIMAIAIPVPKKPATLRPVHSVISRWGPAIPLMDYVIMPPLPAGVMMAIYVP